jgi:hypothetical protein
MLNVVMLSVVLLNNVALSIMAPFFSQAFKLSMILTVETGSYPSEAPYTSPL